MLAPVRTSAPDILPVSPVEAKAHLRVDHGDDDAVIASLIAAATDHLDGWTGILGRCLVEQEWRQDFDAFRSCLPLPLGPVLSISSVTVGGEVVDASDYALITDAGGRSRVEISHIAAGSGPVSITYQAGYATIPEVPEDPGPPVVPAIPAQSTVPPALKVAILLLAGHWYNHPEAVVTGTIATALPFAVNALIAPYRRVGV